MKQNSTALPDSKDNNAVKKYFETVYPTLDFDRVYSSDMKKMIKWYEVLEKNNVDYTAKPEEQEQPVEESVEATPAEEPAAKKTKSKSKATAEAKEEVTAAEEKPKKTAKKKKTEE